MKTMSGSMCQRMVRALHILQSYLPADTVFTVTFHNITDPYNMEATPEPEYTNRSTSADLSSLEERPAETSFHIPPYDDAPGLEALSTAAAGNFEYIRPLSATGNRTVSQHSSNKLNFILNPAGPEGSMSIMHRPLPMNTLTW